MCSKKMSRGVRCLEGKSSLSVYCLESVGNAECCHVWHENWVLVPVLRQGVSGVALERPVNDQTPNRADQSQPPIRDL